MNILTDDLPTAVMVGDQECPVDSDFRTAIRIILAFEDDELAAIEKRSVLIENLYVDQPYDIEAAFIQGIKFLDGGKSNEGQENEYAPRLYSFSKDANFIFAAFRQTHGIDLETTEMHWWKFLALFMDLGSETTFCNLIALRKKVKTGKASKEEKEAARELGEVFEIEEPDDRTLEEKEREQRFMQELGV